jgi:hypothetical protein
LKFESASPSIVRSVKQRGLLNAWLRAFDERGALPRLEEYRPDRIADELAEMMGFDVIGQGDHARFLITQEGFEAGRHLWQRAYRPGPANQPLSGRRHRTGAVRARGPLLPGLRGAPTSDLFGRNGSGRGRQGRSYERLLLPFGSAGAVEHIVGSYKAISIEGGFKIRDLMGASSRPSPVSVVNAVIDQNVALKPSRHAAVDDLVELD